MVLSGASSDIMQRSTSGILGLSVPVGSGVGRTRSSLVSPGEMDDDVSFKDLEKGEKMHWRLKAEQAVHLIPVVLMACVLVLYMFSSVPLLDAQVKTDSASVVATAVERPVVPERHLHQLEFVQPVDVKDTVGVSVQLPVHMRGRTR